MRELVVVVGTRPEIIKMAPVIRAAEGTFERYLVHTGQHYDAEMSGAFFEALDLPAPDENLEIGSGTQGEQTSQALVGVERLLLEREPAAAVALGDTNAVLSTALAASKLSTTFGHVEAGLRSFDRTMPEEVNRVVADHVADLSFAPTEQAVSHLRDEGVTEGVHETGNTVVDACHEHAPLAAERSDVLERFGLDGDYVAATIHRPHNTDDAERLRAVVDALDGASVPVVFPAHPRTQRVLADLDYEPSGSLRLVDPLDYLDFLKLMDHARVVVTDSGGIQEEASVLEVPCLTVRPNTERPETVEAGVNELVEPAELSARLETLLTDADARDAMTGHPDLYGDGDAGERIVAALDAALD
ncbi:non-hydrolyzing UDP-N-acetylglucosamine 2-epimerase [Halomarina ordinaria]|uniref:Non-hydrolyzing UDP-N-acetylglucosamine 2-epimerase n=1 Tax=Halomarina ordinaria TaxID=3033939 RepID=A0ABD5UBW0_9EURY|nr:UDP-N-acetylglucosamine 2-epimerase (non-hydrolyzing) [Halomarina sp. PSRA2]